MQSDISSITLHGIPISPGLAQGTIHVHHGLLGPIDAPATITHHQVEQEVSRLDIATASISDDLIVLATRVEKEIDARLSEVFGAHHLMLNDPSLQQELQQEIVGNLVNASSAVKSVFLRWERRFLSLESQIAREKSTDLCDLSRRMQHALAGITVHPLDELPHGAVLVTSRLLPSDTIFLASRSISAALLEYGSGGSHAALFVREMGIPCISTVYDLMHHALDGRLAQIDASVGIVVVNPTENQQLLFRSQMREEARLSRQARQNAGYPAITRDGVTVAVQANVGTVTDTQLAMDNGAEGVGLYRIEQIYAGRTTPPDSDDLVEEMTQTLLPAAGTPVTVRLLDAGADKPLPFLAFFAESNPALGRRGIRLLREYPELLRTQLAALLELTSAFDLRILIPMVTTPEDVTEVKQFLRTKCEQRQIAVPPIGAIIENPAAALSVCDIARHVDFLSFGTNDLTQYVFAADRDNAAVESYFNDRADAIFRLMRLVHDDVPDMPLSLCGELAGRPEQITNILACGIRTLSVAAPLVPIVKEGIRNCSVESK